MQAVANRHAIEARQRFPTERAAARWLLEEQLPMLARLSFPPAGLKFRGVPKRTTKEWDRLATQRRESSTRALPDLLEMLHADLWAAEFVLRPVAARVTGVHLAEALQCAPLHVVRFGSAVELALHLARRIPTAAELVFADKRALDQLREVDLGRLKQIVYLEIAHSERSIPDSASCGTVEVPSSSHLHWADQLVLLWLRRGGAKAGALKGKPLVRGKCLDGRVRTLLYSTATKRLKNLRTDGLVAREAKEYLLSAEGQRAADALSAKGARLL